MRYKDLADTNKRRSRSEPRLSIRGSSGSHEHDFYSTRRREVYECKGDNDHGRSVRQKRRRRHNTESVLKGERKRTRCCANQARRVPMHLYKLDRDAPRSPASRATQKKTTNVKNSSRENSCNRGQCQAEELRCRNRRIPECGCSEKLVPIIDVQSPLVHASG